MDSKGVGGTSYSCWQYEMLRGATERTSEDTRHSCAGDEERL